MKFGTEVVIEGWKVLGGGDRPILDATSFGEINIIEFTSFECILSLLPS